MPTLTVDQITTIVSDLEASVSFLDSTVRDRLGELTAFDLVSGLIPVGRIEPSEEDLGINDSRITRLKADIQILKRALGDSSADDEDSEDGSVNADGTCEGINAALVLIANNLDFSAQINAIVPLIVAGVVAGLAAQFTAIITRIDEAETAISAKIDAQTSILNTINTRTQTILTNVNNMRTVVDTISTNVTSIKTTVEATQTTVNAINLRTITQSTNINTINTNVSSVLTNQSAYTSTINTISTNVSTLLNEGVEVDLSSVNTKLDAHTTTLNSITNSLTSVSTSVTTINNNVSTLVTANSTVNTKLDTISTNVTTLINEGVDVDLSPISTQLTNIQTTVTANLTCCNENGTSLTSIITTLANLDVSVDFTPVLTAIGVLTTLSNNISADVTATLENTIQIESSLEAVAQEIDFPQLSGSIAIQKCENPTTTAYSGKGFVGLQSLIVGVALQINSLHQELCNISSSDQTDVEGSLPRITCDENQESGWLALSPYTYTGKGLTAISYGINAIGASIAEVQKAVCQYTEPKCFVMAPEEQYHEFEVRRQLLIKWREDNTLPLKKASKWDGGKIPLPIEGLDWCTHLDHLRWHRGNVPGRLYYEGTDFYTGGYFENEDIAVQFLVQLGALSQLPKKNNGFPRITKYGSLRVQPRQCTTRPYAAVITELDANGFPVVVECLSPPRGGC